MCDIEVAQDSARDAAESARGRASGAIAAEMADIERARTRSRMVGSCSRVSGPCVRQVREPYLARVVRDAAFFVSVHEMARRCRNIFFSYGAVNILAVCALVPESVSCWFAVFAYLYARGESILCGAET